MIIVNGSLLTENNLLIAYPKDTTEWLIYNSLSSSEDIYEYPSLSYLRFEIRIRKEIIAAAIELDTCGLRFRPFNKSTCNEEFWHRTDEGGFLLKKNVMPANGIRDIFMNSPKYGTECSTPIIFIYYKALLSIYPDKLFNEIFPEIYLMNWHHVNDNLNIKIHKDITTSIPGDCRYIDNPDYNPENSVWRGANIIDLGDGNYFSHGLGITSIDYILDYLNAHRKTNAIQEAYVSNNTTRPDFKHLTDLYINYLEGLIS